MRDLEEVEAAAVRDACRDELRIDGLLDVTHQQQAADAETEVQDGRHVVDAGAGVRWLERHAAARRPSDLDDRPVHAKSVAGREATAVDAQTLEGGMEGGIAGPRTVHPDLGHAPDSISLQQDGQAGHVILVRMGQHDEVDAPIPRRQAFVEHDQQAIRVGATVDEHPGPGVALDQDGISLPDIEDRHPQATIGSRARRQPGADDDHRQRGQPESCDRRSVAGWIRDVVGRMRHGGRIRGIGQRPGHIGRGLPSRRSVSR